MASNSQQTEKKRLNRDRKMGKARKRKLEKEGSTKSEKDLFGNTLSK
ncbi:MAG: hypothetical protein RMA76_45410 [Deltaproteobacteria bacterium]|jgi:hypothetical protein